MDKAIEKILASCAWSVPQRKWLERVGQQLKVEVIVDWEARRLSGVSLKRKGV